MLTIGLIGYGTIARAVLQILRTSGHADGVVMVGILVRPGHGAATADCGLPVFERVADLIARGPAVVAEAAAQSAVVDYGETILAAGCDLLVTSTGALSSEPVLERLRSRAAEHGARILLPSGAIGGIDAIAAMRIAGLSRVTYRSKKPPAAWKGSAAEGLVDLETLAKPAMFYRGTAREAAQKFPKNANVAATVALAGLGMDRTGVELVADPTVTCNIHEVEADGASGRVAFRLEGAPFPDNPRSSMLTAYSVARTLLNVDAALAI
jgi:aspartate dehydrogenase